MLQKFRILAVLLACTTFATASTVQWNITTIPLTGTSSLSGTFDYDADTSTYSNFDIYFQGLLLNLPAATFSTELFVTQGFVGIGQDAIEMDFGTLTDAGGTVGILNAEYGTCRFSGCNGLNVVYQKSGVGTGTLVSTTPEPATIALSATAGLAFVVTRLRRRNVR